MPLRVQVSSGGVKQGQELFDFSGDTSQQLQHSQANPSAEFQPHLMQSKKYKYGLNDSVKKQK